MEARYTPGMSGLKLNMWPKHNQHGREVPRWWKITAGIRIKAGLLVKSKQIHVCYLHESNNIPFSDRSKSSINEGVREKWLKYYGHTDVFVDWADANTKFKQKVFVRNNPPCEISVCVLCTLVQMENEFEHKLATKISRKAGYSFYEVTDALDKLIALNYISGDKNGGYQINHRGSRFLKKHYAKLL